MEKEQRSLPIVRRHIRRLLHRAPLSSASSAYFDVLASSAVGWIAPATPTTLYSACTSLMYYVKWICELSITSHLHTLTRQLMRIRSDFSHKTVGDDDLSLLISDAPL